MSITLISEPDATMGDITSNVVAVKTQALYEFKRKDHTCTYANVGGDVNITITGNTFMSDRYAARIIGDRIVESLSRVHRFGLST